jgi:hypothetical protein
MYLLEFNTTIKENKITICLSYHLLTNGKIMNEGKIYEIIYDEFNTNYSLYEIAQHILNALQPYCFEVSITPPEKGFNYSYKAIVRK